MYQCHFPCHYFYKQGQQGDHGCNAQYQQYSIGDWIKFKCS